MRLPATINYAPTESRIARRGNLRDTLTVKNMKGSQTRLPHEAIEQFCRRHHIRRLAVFGSVLHGDARPDSDLDVLVEFDPGHVPGLAFFAMEQELSKLLGRKVDLNTPQFLSPYFRDHVMEEAEVQYAAA